jgi:hypothetical protein
LFLEAQNGNYRFAIWEVCGGCTMPRVTKSVPVYQRHRASGQARVTIDGRDIYLGPYGTKASRLEYDRIIGEWIQNGRTLRRVEDETTMAEVAASYVRFARTYHTENGRPTRQYTLVKDTLRFVLPTYGRISAVDFGPLALTPAGKEKEVTD